MQRRLFSRHVACIEQLDLRLQYAATLRLSAESLGTGGIHLIWPPLDSAANKTITISSRAINANIVTADRFEPAIWQTRDTLPGTAHEWTDSLVQDGARLEYRLSVSAGFVSGETRYIAAANVAKAPTALPGALLVIDRTLTDEVGASLRAAIDQYKSDLICEGFSVYETQVDRVDVPRTELGSDTITEHFQAYRDGVQAAKDAIRAAHASHPSIKSVVLVGRVAVPYSGITGIDGHPDHAGAWPADVFYSTLTTDDAVWEATDSTTNTNFEMSVDIYGQPLPIPNANYLGDGKFGVDTLDQLTPYNNGVPVTADVAVGRIDFAMMSKFGSNATVGDQPSDGEVNALRAYFAKNHAFRTGAWNVERQAALDGVSPDRAALFAPSIGAENVKTIELVADGDTPSEDFENQSWMWSFASGAGARFDFAGDADDHDALALGPAGFQNLPGVRQMRADQYASANDAFAPHRAVFNFGFSSYVGDWDYENSLLRATIAEADGYGLVAA